MLVCFTFRLTTSHAQVDKHTISLLTHIIERKSDTSIVAYTRTPGSAYYDYVARYAMKRKLWDRDKKRYALKLTKKEGKFIEEQISLVREKEWPLQLLGYSDLIPAGNANQYSKNYPIRPIYQFTFPIFIRNNSLALIMIKKHAPANAGGSEEISFFKKSGKWWTRLALLEISTWGDLQ